MALKSDGSEADSWACFLVAGDLGQLIQPLGPSKMRTTAPSHRIPVRTQWDPSCTVTRTVSAI